MSERPIRVVLADDAPDIRQLLRLALGFSGRFEVVAEAGDGRAAVDACVRERPDAIVLDLAMPVMDGLQAIPEIREGSPLTRIVVLSGFNAGQMAQQARMLGADAYLEKGSAFDDIASLLTALHERGAPAPAPDLHPGPADDAAPSGSGDPVVQPLISAVANAPNLEAAFELLSNATARLAPFDRASYAVAAAQRGIFTVAATSGSAAWRLPLGATVVVPPHSMAVLAAGRPLVATDTATDPSDHLNRELASRGIRSFVAIPVVVGGEVRGVVSFSSLHPEALTSEHVATLHERVREVAAVLHVLVQLDREREATRRLRDLDHLKNDFMSMVAHDLKSPMTVIAGFADALERGWDTLPDEQKREFVGIMSRNVHHLAELVSDVFMVAHIESGEFQLQIGPIDLERIVRETVEDIAAGAPERAIVLDVPEPLPPLDGDALRQRQVLSNLLYNALKFSPPDEPVVVSAKVVAGSVRVSVTDRGIGIPEEDVGRVFDRFFRAENGRRQDRGGTGLGLYICRSLVSAWDGVIEVESRAGAGSTFWYTVPLSERSDEAAPAERSAVPVR